VDFVDGFADLLHDGRNFVLCHGLRLPQLVVELPSSAHLQDDVDVVLVIEVPIHFDDVGVVEVHLDLQLADELLCYLLLF